VPALQHDGGAGVLAAWAPAIVETIEEVNANALAA
jgi:hypothetical protein